METEHSFQIRAIDDGIPELFETFVVNLISTEGGGRIGEPREARIAIQASDDPSGIIGFDSYPNGIIINEGDVLIFRLVAFLFIKHVIYLLCMTGFFDQLV